MLRAGNRRAVEWRAADVDRRSDQDSAVVDTFRDPMGRTHMVSGRLRCSCAPRLRLRRKGRPRPVQIRARSGCRPPRSTRSWCGVDSTGSPTSTGSPGNPPRAARCMTPRGGRTLRAGGRLLTCSSTVDDHLDEPDRVRVRPQPSARDARAGSRPVATASEPSPSRQPIRMTPSSGTR